jgi:hypothetical protein
MNNTGIILTLAYPDTIVMISEEWFSNYLRFFGIGKKNYVRAGHAALVLIDKKTGILEYHDFGRYITSKPNGRVRGNDTDCELEFPIKADIVGGKIINLNAILEFLATHQKLTHGDGKLVASVCGEVDYSLARKHITKMQRRLFIRYAAFVKDGCNCARFVTDSLIACVTNERIKKGLIASKWFTPSTVGSVLLANTEDKVFEVSELGVISIFEGSQKTENVRCFLDKLADHTPNFEGALHPKHVGGLHAKAQWLPGIAAGAWFELHPTEVFLEYVFRRISPHGSVDIHAVFFVNDGAFVYDEVFEFVHYSNCKVLHIRQHGRIFEFKQKV